MKRRGGQSCDREVGWVRNAVGVCDVSTLGKIDIQGPDSAQLLDFVYTNMFSTLKENRVRYGLMLREDGFVMDDGTTGAARTSSLCHDHNHRRGGSGDATSGIRFTGSAPRLGCTHHVRD